MISIDPSIALVVHTQREAIILCIIADMLTLQHYIHTLFIGLLIMITICHDFIIQTVLFTAQYLVMGGGVLYFDGLTLSSIYLDGSFDGGINEDNSESYWVIVEFVGALTSILFHVSCIIMAQCV